MSERIMLFDPRHGLGLTIAAGSGRSWMEQPGGDPVNAHLAFDVPGDSLIPAPAGSPRLRSSTVFVPWADLLRFADGLADLAERPAGEVILGELTVRLREDGRLRAEVRFAVGHHVEIEVRAATRWDWHHGDRADLPALAERVRAAVRATRPT